MSFEGTSNARWRGRAIAVAGIATAATIAGFALATSAQAATAPSVTWNAPTQVVNDGSASASATLVVNNSATGTVAIGPHVVARLTIVGPASLNCANVTVSDDINYTGLLSGTNGTCVGDVTFSQAAANTTTYTEQITVNQAGLTGTLTSNVALIQRNVGDSADVATIAASNADTTALVNGFAASFNAAPPAAIVHQPYSYQFLASSGFPATTSFTVLRSWTDNSNVVHTFTHDTCSLTVPNDTCDLGSTGGTNSSYRFVFTPSTGKITAAAIGIDQTNSVRFYSYQIIANNGEGGAQIPLPAGLSLHDVASPSFTLPVLFSDVSLSHVFAKEIYDLADDGDISGFADGTFRPTADISRQAFVTILAGYRGTCSFFDPSPFSDVPNNSPFCEPIRDLAADGIVNGFSDGTFHPAANVTRQAMAAFFYRANAVWNLDISDPGDALCTQPIPFNDVSSSNPFCGDIEWMAANGIANGFSDGGFHPTAASTRQATAAFIDRFDNL